MKNPATQDIIGKLNALLEQERTALINGDLNRIGDLLEHKEYLIGMLNSLDATQDDLSLLHGKVSRNQSLLDSALDGIRTVARRLATLRRVRRSLDTYDARGHKTTIQSNSVSTVEKRA